MSLTWDVLAGWNKKHCISFVQQMFGKASKYLHKSVYSVNPASCVYCAFFSTFSVGAVSSAVSRMGHILAPHVHRCGSRLLPESIRHSDQHGSTVDGAFVVAASGLKGDLHAPWLILE